MITIGILSFLGTFIWYRDRLIVGIAVSIIVLTLSLIFYAITKRQLFDILNKIDSLRGKI